MVNQLGTGVRGEKRRKYAVVEKIGDGVFLEKPRPQFLKNAVLLSVACNY